MTIASLRSRHVGGLLLAATLLPATALAQTTARPVEVFVGYSLLPADGMDFPRQTSHGVELAIGVNLTKWFGLVADFAAQFNTAHDLGPGFEGVEASSRVTEYLFGPRFVARSERVDVFGHGLFGIARGDAGDNFRGFSDSGMAFGGGGGLDVHVQRRVAIRMQFDVLGSFADIVEGNSRIGVGLVMGFGGP